MANLQRQNLEEKIIIKNNVIKKQEHLGKSEIRPHFNDDKSHLFQILEVRREKLTDAWRLVRALSYSDHKQEEPIMEN